MGKFSKDLIKSGKASWNTSFYYRYDFDMEGNVVNKATYTENNQKFEEYHYEYFK